MDPSTAIQEIQLISLLLIAVTVAVITKYIRVPYTISLVLVGLLVGTSRIMEGIELSEEIIFYVFLPPLLFEGALRMDFQHLKENAKSVAFLAIPGVIVSVAIIGSIIHYALGLSFPISLLFAALITPTDPVSVLALFRKLGAPTRLSTILEGESVFNDGTGIVVFGIILSMIATGEIDFVKGGIDFIFVGFGGALIGLVMGYATYKVLRHIDDHLIEVTITLILAFSVFLIAEQLGVSGVIGVVFAGLVIGNYGQLLSMSPTTRVALVTVWDFVVFIVNSLVFLLIGNEIHIEGLISFLGEISIAIAAVLIARILVVYPVFGIINFRVRDRIPLKWQHVISWGGLHGTIPIALVLGLPKAFPDRELIVTMTFGVVLFSLVVQGLTLGPLISRFKIITVSQKEREYEEKLGRAIAIKAAKEEIKTMSQTGEISQTISNEFLDKFEKQTDELARDIAALVSDYELLQKEERFLLKRRVLQAKKSAIQDALRRGVISEHVTRTLVEEIDVELDLLYHGEIKDEKVR
jgi:Na+:H+ antiporter